MTLTQSDRPEEGTVFFTNIRPAGVEIPVEITQQENGYVGSISIRGLRPGEIWHLTAQEKTVEQVRAVLMDEIFQRIY